jgi:hypothetical protein
MFHSGAADGAFSFMERRADGVAFAVIVNRGLRTGPTPVATLLAAIGKVTTWPTADLFSVY